MSRRDKRGREMARRARGGRESDYEHEVLIWSRPRGRFAFFFAMEKEGRRPRLGPLEEKSYLWRRNQKTPRKRNGTAVKNRKSPDGKLKIPLPHRGFVIFNKLPLSELRVAHRSRVQLRPQTRPAPVGSRFEKPQPEVNSVRGKVLPPAKRLDGALAPPHLRWGPRRGAAGSRFHIGGLFVLL